MDTGLLTPNATSVNQIINECHTHDIQAIKVDLVGLMGQSFDGTGATYIYMVDTFNDLPSAINWSDKLVYVRFTVNSNPFGFYRSNGISWIYATDGSAGQFVDWNTFYTYTGITNNTILNISLNTSTTYNELQNLLNDFNNFSGTTNENISSLSSYTYNININNFVDKTTYNIFSGTTNSNISSLSSYTYINFDSTFPYIVGQRFTYNCCIFIVKQNITFNNSTPFIERWMDYIERQNDNYLVAQKAIRNFDPSTTNSILSNYQIFFNANTSLTYTYLTVNYASSCVQLIDAQTNETLVTSVLAAVRNGCKVPSTNDYMFALNTGSCYVSEDLGTKTYNYFSSGTVVNCSLNTWQSGSTYVAFFNDTFTTLHAVNTSTLAYSSQNFGGTQTNNGLGGQITISGNTLVTSKCSNTSEKIHIVDLTNWPTATKSTIAFTAPDYAINTYLLYNKIYFISAARIGYYDLTTSATTTLTHLKSSSVIVSSSVSSNNIIKYIEYLDRIVAVSNCQISTSAFSPTITIINPNTNLIEYQRLISPQSGSIKSVDYDYINNFLVCSLDNGSTVAASILCIYI